MRGGLIIVMILAAGICVGATSKTHTYSHFVKHRTRPREIRGFKPEYISTAIGFGKRKDTFDGAKLNKQERILSTLLQNFPRGIPLEWLLREMKTNPIFAAKLTQLLMDEQNDLLSIIEPDTTISVF